LLPDQIFIEPSGLITHMAKQSPSGKTHPKKPVRIKSPRRHYAAPMFIN